MPPTLTRPIQVFLDTQRLIQTQPTRTRGPNRDFYKGNNAGFERHKARLRQQIEQARAGLVANGDPAGFVMVQMKEEGLGKSYRPLGALFTTPNNFALVGGGAIGQMYFQATPSSLERIDSIIDQRAEVEPRLARNPRTDELEERVSAYRSELGAIEEVRLPVESDRLGFSAQEAVGWLEQEGIIGGYIVELFQPDPRVTPQAVAAMVRRFQEHLFELGGVTALPFASRRIDGPQSFALSVDLRLDGPTIVELPFYAPSDVSSETENLPSVRTRADRSLPRHQALLDLLAREPLVRRVELPLRVQSSPSVPTVVSGPASIPQPVPGETYPTVGVIDSGIATVQPLNPWRAGGADLIAGPDRDEAHGSFIAGLLAGAGSLNPTIADRFEPTPCRHFDIDVLPRRGLMARYYQTPNEFFDQLDAQVEAAKASNGVRVFNMSLGAPGVRQGLGYSSFAAHLDRIAKARDVIFVVSAGNLRGSGVRPEWPAGPDEALQMLASRGAADERIMAPGEHLYGLTVGALNGPDIAGSTADVPTTYTRRGPGPGGARKPEVCQIGGISSRSGNASGLYSVGTDGSTVDGSGTSYATPLVTSTLATLDHRLEGQASRETLLALAVHKAAKPQLLRAKLLRAVARDFVGFGIPVHADQSLSDEPHSITLVFSDILPFRRELSFIFTWPRSLTTEDGKCRGRVDITLAHTPPVDAAFDAECQRVQLDAHLYQLEEKSLDTGEVVPDPQSRLKHSDSELPQHLEYTERYLLESGLKWTPIKRYERAIPRGVGTTSEWKLALKALTRAGAVYPDLGIPFTLVMTISDPRGIAGVYEEVRAEIIRRGLTLADITVAQRVRARGS